MERSLRHGAMLKIGSDVWKLMMTKFLFPYKMDLCILEIGRICSVSSKPSARPKMYIG